MLLSEVIMVFSQRLVMLVEFAVTQFLVFLCYRIVMGRRGFMMLDHFLLMFGSLLVFLGRLRHDRLSPRMRGCRHDICSVLAGLKKRVILMVGRVLMTRI